MPIRVVCPSCSSELRVPDNSAGRKIKCPNCGTAFVAPDSAGKSQNFPVRTLPNLVKKPTEPTFVPEDNDLNFLSQARRQPSAAASGHKKTTGKYQSQTSFYLGIASLVVDMISLLACWLPLVGILGGGLGLVLGIVGLVSATRSGSSKNLTIVSSALSAVIIVLGIGYFILIIKSNQKNSNETANITSNETANITKEDNVSKLTDHYGDLEVEVRKLTIGQVRLQDSILDNELSTSRNRHLMIELQIHNTHPNKIKNYDSWSGRGHFGSSYAATLTDNFGNSYSRCSFGLSYPVGGVYESESIYPNRSVTDILVFEVPVDEVEYLQLVLPAKNLGGKGTLNLKIPGSLIKR